MFRRSICPALNNLTIPPDHLPQGRLHQFEAGTEEPGEPPCGFGASGLENVLLLDLNVPAVGVSALQQQVRDYPALGHLEGA